MIDIEDELRIYYAQHDDDDEAVTRITARLATRRGRMRRVARRPGPSGDVAADRRRPIAVAAAIAAVVMITFGTFVVGRAADRSTMAPATTDASALISTSWELTRVVDAAGKVPAPASAPVVFTFEQGYATDHVGDAASARISTGRIQLGMWANNLMFYRAPHLDIAQSNFVYALMSGAMTWSVSGDTLTMRKPSLGYLVFMRSTASATLDRPYGNASGRFLAVGGPPSSRSPRTQTGSGTVQFRNTRTGQTQTVDTTTDGTYNALLAPGTYTVDGRISTYQSGGAACTAPRSVIVDKDRTTKADLYCQEK